MQFVRSVAALAIVVAAGLLASACSSDGTSGSASGGSGGEPPAGTTSWEEGEPVQGNWSVSWKNLDPKYPANTISVVNASSEIGQKLLSGKATSTEVRVATDSQMGTLVSELRRLGFFQYATDGVSLENVPSVASPKGLVVVTQDGSPKGLLMQLGLGGSPIPETYTNCKKIVVAAHGQLPGFDARSSLGPPDESIFSGPPVKLKRP